MYATKGTSTVIIIINIVPRSPPVRRNHSRRICKVLAGVDDEEEEDNGPDVGGDGSTASGRAVRELPVLLRSRVRRTTAAAAGSITAPLFPFELL